MATWSLIAWGPSALAQGPVQQPALSYGAEIALRSGHADRGFVINDRAVLQPETWLTVDGATLSLWGSLALSETTDGSRPEIAELELTHEQKWRRVSFAPAIRMFLYHDPLSLSDTRSIEGWVFMSYDAGPVQLFSNHSVDLRAYPGAYYGEAGIASERHLSPAVEVGGSLGAGWASASFNEAYAGIATAALDRVSLEGWVTARVAPHVTVGPRFEFSTIVDPAVRAQLARPTYLLLGFATGVEH